MVTVLKSSAIRKGARVDCCHRCGGLMVQEKVFELGAFDWHCVSCGERVDPVIVAHRQTQGPTDGARGDAEKLVAGKGKTGLN